MEKTFEFQRDGIERLGDPLVFIRRQRGEQHIPVVVAGGVKADAA